MNEPKRHHYVPRLYLRNFANEDGRLWVYDMHSEASFAVSPDKIAAENDFNRLPSLFEQLDHPLAVETAFAKQEAQVAPILVRVLDQVRTGSANDLLKISADERITLSPDGRFKFPHLWPVKFLRAGRGALSVGGRVDGQA